MNIRSTFFKDLQLIVIKIGTKILISPTGKVYKKSFSSLAKEISKLKKRGVNVIVVTSGSVGMGMSILGHIKRPNALDQKQACAALGQGELIHLYSKAFKRYDQKIAQILLSAEDFKNKQRCDNIKNTLNILLKEGVIPIVNENDTISTEEIKVGDNDKLSADVSIFLNANLLIMLSDEEGLYTKNPKKYTDATLISIVPEINSKIQSSAKGAGSSNSVGGMRSKVKAIKQANQGNVLVSLLNLKNNNLVKLFNGENVGTLFLPSQRKLKQNKKWLGLISNAKGQITIDQGAFNALKENHSSLLLAGITHFKGHFKAKDFVEVLSSKGPIIARGQSSYSSDQLTDLLSSNLNLKDRSKLKEAIHRDYLVLY